MAKEQAEGTAEETTEETAPTKEVGFDGIVDDLGEAELAETEATKETETTKETQEDDSTTEVESISDEQYAEAEKLGITRSQADSIGVDGLPRVMRKLTPPDSAQTSDAPASRDAAQTLVEDTSGAKQTGVGLDPDIYDADLVKYIDEGRASVEAEVARRLGPIQERLHKLTVEAELKDELETTARFNGFIDSLGESYHKEFGSTTPTSTQQANRSEVRSNMEVERIGREALSLPSFSEDKLFQRALSKGHPEKAKQLVREEISSTLKKRATQNISRPTQSKGKPLTGRQKAYRHVSAKLVEMGRGEDAVSTDEDQLSSLTG